MARRRRAHKRRAHNRIRYRAHRSSRRAHNPHRRRGRRRAHNPFKLGGLGHEVTGALIGAAGAIGTDVAMAYLPLPAQLQTGWMNLLTRAAVALGVGYVAGKVAGPSTGRAVGAGGLIVVAYSGLKQALAPTLGTSIKGLSGLADFGDYSPASYGNAAVGMVGGGLGAYMQPRLGAYMNPAAILSPGGAGASPIRQKQMGAYMRSGMGSFASYDSESM